MANTIILAKLSNPDYLDLEVLIIAAIDKDEARIAVDDYYRREWSTANEDTVSYYKDYEKFTDSFSEEFEQTTLFPLK